jgi:UDP-N-acetylglucosamine 4,6-dehydratase
VRDIGIRPGEKLHEVLLSEDEARHSIEMEHMFVVQPVHTWWRTADRLEGRELPESFRYASDSNPQWLTIPELRQLAQVEAAE